MLEMGITFLIQVAVIMAVITSVGNRRKWKARTQDVIIFGVSMVALAADLTRMVLDWVR